MDHNASEKEKDVESAGHVAVVEVDHENDIVEAAENQYTEEDYKRVLKKIDLCLIPIMWSKFNWSNLASTAVEIVHSS
jgi:hypothetical protein